MENFETEKVKFGDLKPGDKIIGPNGSPVEVKNVFEKHLPKKMYEIEMEDGEKIKASGNHMWYCESNSDRMFKEGYKRLALEFFENKEIPPKMLEDELFSTEDLIKIFGDEIDTILFIEKACKSLGYSSYTPHLTFDGFPREEEISNRGIIMNHSYNDFVDFISDMKSCLTTGIGYFYFGEVRTTDEIVYLLKKGEEINIPHKSDLKDN